MLGYLPADIRDLTYVRRRRWGRLLAKKCFYFTLEFRIYLELSGSVFVGIKTCPCWIWYECVQFEIEIRKISRWGSSSPNNAEFGHFSLLFCRGRQRNVPRIITHVHSCCSAHQIKCFVWRLNRCRCCCRGKDWWRKQCSRSPHQRQTPALMSHSYNPSLILEGGFFLLLAPLFGG